MGYASLYIQQKTAQAAAHNTTNQPHVRQKANANTSPPSYHDAAGDMHTPSGRRPGGVVMPAHNVDGFAWRDGVPEVDQRANVLVHEWLTAMPAAAAAGRGLPSSRSNRSGVAAAHAHGGHGNCVQERAGREGGREGGRADHEAMLEQEKAMRRETLRRQREAERKRAEEEARERLRLQSALEARYGPVERHS